jgi:hypothetical protein
MSHVAAALFALAAFVACSKDQPAGTTHDHADHGHDHGPADDHGHAHDDGHDHGDDPAHEDGHDHGDGHAEHGPVIELGSTVVADWTVRATRDEGTLAPGSEAAIDVWLTGGFTNVTAVRFWIGVESAAGSMKALASIEDPAEPSRWHAHAELPNPLPDGSALWVELELKGRGKQRGSIDLFPE